MLILYKLRRQQCHGLGSGAAAAADASTAAVIDIWATHFLSSPWQQLSGDSGRTDRSKNTKHSYGKGENNQPSLSGDVRYS